MSGLPPASSRPSPSPARRKISSPRSPRPPTPPPSIRRPAPRPPPITTSTSSPCSRARPAPTTPSATSPLMAPTPIRGTPKASWSASAIPARPARRPPSPTTGENPFAIADAAGGFLGGFAGSVSGQLYNDGCVSLGQALGAAVNGAGIGGRRRGTLLLSLLDSGGSAKQREGELLHLGVLQPSKLESLEEVAMIKVSP